MKNKNILTNVHSIVRNEKVMLLVFIGVTIIGYFQFFQTYNNFLLYKYASIHLINGENLYNHYPELYFDRNNYNPFISVLFLPFAYLPESIAIFLFGLVLVIMYILIYRLIPVPNHSKYIFFWLTIHEYYVALINLQNNLFIAFSYVAVFYYLSRNKYFKGALFTCLGIFKLYSLFAGFLFLLFKNKVKYIICCVFLSIVFLFSPLLLTSWDLFVQSYIDWLGQTGVKVTLENAPINIGSLLFIFFSWEVNYFYVFGIGVLFLFLIYFLNRAKKNNSNFNKLFLSLVLVWFVLFNPTSESPTYIIACVGIGIWFALKKQFYLLDYILLILFILFSMLYSSDIYPRYLRTEYLYHYRVKAIPCLLIFIRIIYEFFSLNASSDNAQPFPSKNSDVADAN